MDNDTSKETGRQPEQKSTTERINDFLERQDKNIREFFSNPDKPNTTVFNLATVTFLAAMLWPNPSADLSMCQEFLKSLTASTALGFTALINLQQKDEIDENK